MRTLSSKFAQHYQLDNSPSTGRVYHQCCCPVYFPGDLPIPRQMQPPAKSNPIIESSINPPQNSRILVTLLPILPVLLISLPILPTLLHPTFNASSNLHLNDNPSCLHHLTANPSDLSACPLNCPSFKHPSLD